MKNYLLSLMLILSSSYAGGDFTENTEVEPHISLFDVPNKLKSLFSDNSIYMFSGLSITTVTHNFNDKSNQTDASLGIRFGMQSTSWRTLIDYSADWRGYKSLTLETDKLFPAHKVLSRQIAPYAGLSIGYFDHKQNNTEHAIFGLHGGLIVNISKNVDLDVGLSYKRKRKSENLDDSKALSLSVHYFF